ncbi:MULTISPECIES: hypothetical protein [unclassified Paenibacillus]|uniref:hypothetical protein n=1 Tax=unclassified Paenibacillus TaxID=185978 RepID=UPI0011A7F317|nr:hypothetical protein [Paenibacillus sp. Y412MC10]
MSRRKTGDAAEETEAVTVLHSSRKPSGMMAEPDKRSAETTEQGEWGCNIICVHNPPNRKS